MAEPVRGIDYVVVGFDLGVEYVKVSIFPTSLWFCFDVKWMDDFGHSNVLTLPWMMCYLEMLCNDIICYYFLNSLLESMVGVDCICDDLSYLVFNMCMLEDTILILKFNLFKNQTGYVVFF